MRRTESSVHGSSPLPSLVAEILPGKITMQPGWLIRPESGQMTLMISEAMDEQLV